MPSLVKISVTESPTISAFVVPSLGVTIIISPNEKLEAGGSVIENLW